MRLKTDPLSIFSVWSYCYCFSEVQIAEKSYLDSFSRFTVQSYHYDYRLRVFTLSLTLLSVTREKARERNNCAKCRGRKACLSSPDFCAAISFEFSRYARQGTTHIVIKSNSRRSYICIHSADLTFEILKMSVCHSLWCSKYCLREESHTKRTGCSSDILNSTPS